jgi:hypothetical protein
VTLAKPQELQDEPAFFFRFDDLFVRNPVSGRLVEDSRPFQTMSEPEFVPLGLRIIFIKRVRHPGPPLKKTLFPGIINTSLVPECGDVEIVSLPPERSARSRMPWSPK